MNNKILRCLWGIIKTVFVALYLFAFYQLALVPAILDWSSFGVLITLGLAALLIWSVSKEKRLSTAVLGIAFLLAMKALYNISDYPMWKFSLSALFIFIVLLVVGKLLGRFSIRSYITVFLVALILNSTVDISKAPFWTEFNVKWESRLLYPRFATVDYFPIKLVDVDGDNIKELVTQENLTSAQAEQEDIVKHGDRYQVLKPESNHFAVYKWDGRTFRELSPDKYDLRKLEASLPIDYIGYPYYEMAMNVNPQKGVEQRMTPYLDRAQVIEHSMDFGRFPFEILALDQKSLETTVKNLSMLGQPVDSATMATGKFEPGKGTEAVSIDESLKVKDNQGKNVVAQIDRGQVPDIGTSEVIAGDVNNDKVDELILTSETSRILKLSKDKRWQILWSNPEPTNEKDRFIKFRFDDFSPLGSDKTPQFVALSKSNVRDNPTRYMTGYVYKDGTLKQTWRVFSGLINLRAGDIDGDGQNELVGYMYRGQKVFVLEKHHIPVVGILYGITGFLILLGFGLQWRQRKNNISGGEKMRRNDARLYPLTILILLVFTLIFTGCAIKSGPKVFTKPATPETRPAPDATSILSKAFDVTAKEGSKFYFSGWQVTKIQKRSVSLISSGSVDKAKGYILDARIFGLPYRYYRWGNDVYLSDGDQWRKVSPTQTPLEPFADFTKLRFLTGKAVQLPDEEILSKKCNVYQIPLDYNDAVKASSAMGVKLPAGSGAGQFMRRLKMNFTIWVGKKDNFIYQYKTDMNMPVPGAGSLYQEVKFKFWDYNASTVNIPGPEKIERYLVKE